MKIINFKATDGVILDGILYESNKKTDEIIISVHGMGSNCFKKRDAVISEYANKNGIDYLCFNNRGSELVKNIKKESKDKISKQLGGTTYEDVLDGYYDIVGAIIKAKELGYKKIYLQGHSLGCTKIVYTYNRLKEENNMEILNDIKSIILLSLIDIPSVLKIYLGDKFDKYVELAENNRNGYELMPKDAFIHPISTKSFLRYAKENEDIDFAGYGRDKKLIKLNNIKIPLFMRWGNINEMVAQDLKNLVEIIKQTIDNENLDVDYIDGADHSYTDKEEMISKQIIEFIRK